MAILQKYEAGNVAEEAWGADSHDVRHNDMLNNKEEKHTPPPVHTL